MGTSLGPKYIPYSYMEPLGLFPHTQTLNSVVDRSGSGEVASAEAPQTSSTGTCW